MLQRSFNRSMETFAELLYNFNKEILQFLAVMKINYQEKLEYLKKMKSIKKIIPKEEIDTEDENEEIKFLRKNISRKKQKSQKKIKLNGKNKPKDETESEEKLNSNEKYIDKEIMNLKRDFKLKTRIKSKEAAMKEKIKYLCSLFEENNFIIAKYAIDFFKNYYDSFYLPADKGLNGYFLLVFLYAKCCLNVNISKISNSSKRLTDEQLFLIFEAICIFSCYDIENMDKERFLYYRIFDLYYLFIKINYVDELWNERNNILELLENSRNKTIGKEGVYDIIEEMIVENIKRYFLEKSEEYSE